MKIAVIKPSSRIPEQPLVSLDREALAPYNFIPLPERVVTLSAGELPDQGVFHSDLLTGSIECELTTASPMFIRSGIRPELAASGKQSKDQPDFFYLNEQNEPVVPGSSLRGMIRTLVEIITYSKIGSVTDNPLVYRSVGGTTNHDAHYRSQLLHLDNDEKTTGSVKYYTPLVRGGYMVKTGRRDWSIQPAKVIGGATYAHIGIDEDFFRKLHRVKNCQNAFEIYVQTGPLEYHDVRGGFLKIKFAKVLQKDAAPRPGLRPAVLARSGWMSSKRSEAVVFERDPHAKPLILSDEQIDAYREQISKEQAKLLGKNGVLNDGQPVFYLMDEETGKVKFFGHSRMFRIPYPRSPRDHVPEYARPTDEPNDPDCVDFAEAIFGYTRQVGTGRQRAYAGRVSISDARLASGQDNIWLSQQIITPKILSGPKPTTFQHYLVQREPEKYIIGQTRDGRPVSETRLHDYESTTPGETVIRGHKFYWHKGPVGTEEVQETGDVNDGDTQHTRIRPLKPGVRFHFQVTFTNLRPEELGAILWILNVAADEHIRLKIGMGKPLGLGSVSISPRLWIRKPQQRYGTLLSEGKWADGCSRADKTAQEVIKSFLEAMKAALNKDVPVEKQIDDFMKARRIQALLIMLQWPGPDKSMTRYMEIEHPDPQERRGRRNEYKERPVLPGPFGVWKKR